MRHIEAFQQLDVFFAKVLAYGCKICMQVLAIICRSYGAYRDLDAGSYKDFAPTEHDLGLPNVQTPQGTARSAVPPEVS